MKRYFCVLLTSLICLSGYSQNYYLASPQGYGAGTTGGGNAIPVTVSTYAALKTNMTAAGAKVILVSGEITIPSGQPISAIITNKSIIGLPGAKLINETQSNPGAGIFYLKPGSNNVIIRNLIFIGPGAYDIDGQDNLTADGCTNLWVDHCEFQDGQDGNLDIKGLSDNITVSWTKFTYLKPAVPGGFGGSNDHRFSNLIGSSATNAPADGHYSVTFQNVYWANGCKERMPRARNAELHLLSCYFNTSVSGSKAIGLGGGINNTTCYVENSNFAKVGTVYGNYPADGGTVALAFVNTLKGGANLGTVSAPTYLATAIPVDKVEMFLTDATCGAGASLQVSADGIISPSNCTSLAVSDQTSVEKKMSAQVSNNTLFLNIPKEVNGNAEIQIFSASGQLIKTHRENVKNTAQSIINIESLKEGIYFVSARFDNDSFRIKFLKR